MGQESNINEPLLRKSEVSGYASASLFSKAFWMWMNPLLTKGYKTPLKIEEVPSISPEHKAERLSQLFESKWPKPEENCKNPVRTTLLRCFWKDIAFTAFLAIIRLVASYVGPVLINSFVNFTAGKGSSPNEGYYLLLILLLSKFVEVFSSHHFNFSSQKLGMKIKASLITCLYKKSLKLSCSARQAHGVGPIVSYMAVDAQQLSDMIPQLHAIWLMPLQVGVALVLLYHYLGVSALVALVVVVLILVFALYVTKKNNINQYFVMRNRDERLKATSEVLNNMRVIKFQAWEDHFNKRIQSCRDNEFKWLSRFWYWISGNLIVLWSTSVVISTVTFGVSILMGVRMDAATVFTATTTIRTLQEPLRTFPQALISFSQAVISLGRLDTYMTSKELDTKSVERVEGCDGNVAVKVEDGIFGWDDENTESVLKNINLEVKKGEITAIVGTVGAGKSSLLASIMGEMHRISGKDCVRGALRGKTILLVTHQVDFLHNVDLILVMRDGMIVQSGKYNALLDSGLDFGALVAAHETSMELVEVDQTNAGGNSPKYSPKTPKSPQGSFHLREGQGENKLVDQSGSDKGTSKLIKDEERETGKVSLKVYKQYCTRAFGWPGAIAVVLLSLVWLITTMGTDFWLQYETSDARAALFNPSLFMGVYAIIGVVSVVMVTIRTFVVTIIGLKTAQTFFSQLLRSILHAPMSFFDTTPSGRILSRASSDQTNIDITLPLFMSMSITMYMTLLSILIIVCLNAWPTTILLIPLAWANYWYRGYYLSSARELTRLDQITKAPVIHHFSETISGFMTIRSFQKQNRFCEENLTRVNSNLRMTFHNNGSSEWLGFRLELLGSLFFCTATMFMILLPSSIIDPASVGMALSYGMALDSVLFFVVYISCLLENQMVSVERIEQFTNIPSESAWEIEDRHPPPSWPDQGNVDIKDLQVRYRPNTPLILKGITLSFRGGEKIGTVRSNIDPTGQYTDDEIWKSLERCQLKDVVTAKPDKLDSLVTDQGDNWSVGQKQLLCLGRVMLKRSRLLFMDEATASVDSQTDAVIQKIIREDFAACTIISIAHRIPTVMDCDKVLVIDAGWAKEFDKPSRLLERPTIFASLVQEYSNRSEEL
ncbi:hypothetical protein Q3G72_002759 [Acer saccharum]|nr:hypothetical protein Q3G72_002759 [Acer saccharum]